MGRKRLQPSRKDEEWTDYAIHQNGRYAKGETMIDVPLGPLSFADCKDLIRGPGDDT